MICMLWAVHGSESMGCFDAQGAQSDARDYASDSYCISPGGRVHARITSLLLSMCMQAEGLPERLDGQRHALLSLRHGEAHEAVEGPIEVAELDVAVGGLQQKGVSPPLLDKAGPAPPRARAVAARVVMRGSNDTQQDRLRAPLASLQRPCPRPAVDPPQR